jgi:primary-amine oxidase
VAPHLVAPYHDHFLCFRFDLDVDGSVNSFVPGRITRRALPAGSPRRSLWVWDSKTVARREAEARTRIDLERPALWQVINPERRNALGNPTSYVISPERVIAPLLSPDDPPKKRAQFTDYHLWVTPYRPDERYAAGRFPNQSRGGDGLPSWTRANRSIEATDLVVWYTMGFRHVTAAEDWPVLATKWSSVTLRPFNFFDRNPTINLRSPGTD